MKDLLLRARVVFRISNMKISRGHLPDYVKTLHQKASRTCSTIIFLHSINQIIDLWRCCWRCCRQILNSLVIPPNSNTFSDWRSTCHVSLVKTSWRPRANKASWRPRATTTWTFDSHVNRSCTFETRGKFVCQPRQANNFLRSHGS